MQVYLYILPLACIAQSWSQHTCCFIIQIHFIVIKPFIMSKVFPSGPSDRNSLLSVLTRKYPCSVIPVITADSTPGYPDSSTLPLLEKKREKENGLLNYCRYL